ncbi:hypothetical protein [Caldalkalibacillus salinus]|uniref:hypothetical protein n=1 Tax=Caldalkalibacillus salinus TaxID=2803787 RepID=UPI00192490E7|nr:hypothetical protein [Caldalkalibacillus salinus]
MIVTVNDIEVRLFRGATLKHALLKADDTLYHQVQRGEAQIQDYEGNLVGINGAVANGWRYQVVKR